MNASLAAINNQQNNEKTISISYTDKFPLPVHIKDKGLIIATYYIIKTKSGKFMLQK